MRQRRGCFPFTFMFAPFGFFSWTSRKPVFTNSLILMLPNLVFVLFGNPGGFLKGLVYLLLGFGVPYFLSTLIRPKWAFLLLSPMVLLVPVEVVHIWLFNAPVSLGMWKAILESNSMEIREQISGYWWLVVLYIPFIWIYFRNVIRLRKHYKFSVTRRKRIVWYFVILNWLVYSRDFYISQKYRYQNDFAMALIDAKDQFLLKYERIFPVGPWLKWNQVRIRNSKVNQRQDNLKTFDFGARQQNLRKDSLMPNQTLILVIGESARGDHFGINGYFRKTTPMLRAISADTSQLLISFSNAFANANLTSISIPQILTRANPKQPELFWQEKSLISLFKQAGFRTYWVSNQELANSDVQLIANESDYFIDMGNQFDKTGSYDEMLIPVTDSLLELREPKKLIILHTLGSHFRYNYRYPEKFQKFTPALSGEDDYTNVLKKDNKELLVNSYDNSILYTDYILSELIWKLRLKQGSNMLVYFSDHGESLYEENLVLHGTPEVPEEQLDVPLLFWFGGHYDTLKVNVLQERVRTNVTLESVFYTLPDLYSISHNFEDPTLTLSRMEYKKPDSIEVRTVNQTVVRLKPGNR